MAAATALSQAKTPACDPVRALRVGRGVRFCQFHCRTYSLTTSNYQPRNRLFPPNRVFLARLASPMIAFCVPLAQLFPDVHVEITIGIPSAQVHTEMLCKS